MNWFACYIALPIGVLLVIGKFWAMLDFQFRGRYRILESLEGKNKYMIDLVNDRSIPYFARKNLWWHLGSMQNARLIRYDLEPRRAPGEDPVKIYRLCDHGVRLLKEKRAERLLSAEIAERTKRKKRAPGPT